MCSRPRHQNDTDITVQGEALEEVGSFTCLGSIMDNHRGTGLDVRARISLARATFHRQDRRRRITFVLRRAKQQPVEEDILQIRS
ncbi:hypothetical protein DPMN_143679 [Dreissena polymorpha]|uniref:Uncharacterized protein n=1 Tax=Dreissena polymorpha TaxID=45954 RepID=A0A9D4GE08_DREPO|nr:hypothetical protein DPMN_143679 [Dreissena polymorpha]